MEATMIDFRNRMTDCRSEMPKAGEFAAAGMWADHDDLSNPTEYVGKLREHLRSTGTRSISRKWRS